MSRGRLVGRTVRVSLRGTTGSVLLSATLVLGCAGATEDPVVAALPSGSVVAEIMHPVTPPRVAELTAKLQAAVQQDADWWLLYAERAEPGETLPWDRRLGLTEAEYAEYLSLLDQVQLQSVGEAQITFAHGADGRITLRTDSSLPDLDGIVIDPVNGYVDTPFGRATHRSPIKASARQSATGPWNGVQWSSEELGATGRTGTVVEFAVGRLGNDDRGILHYDAKQVTDDGSTRSAGQVLFFPLANRGIAPVWYVFALVSLGWALIWRVAARGRGSTRSL